MDRNGDGQLDAADLVVFLQEPLKARFESTIVRAMEGSGEAVLTVVFSKPFTGVLRYEVGDSNLATEGEDFLPLPGNVTVVDGLSCEIPVTLPDDWDLEGVEALEVRIKQDDAYTVVSPSDCTLYIDDNDALWKGLVTRELSGGVGFDLVILRDEDVVHGYILGSETGLIPPSDPPEDGWSAESFTVTEDTFDLTVQGIPVPAEDTMRLATTFTRSFEFSYEAEDKTLLTETQTKIAGHVVERLVPDDVAFTHLARESEGIFLLVKVPGDVNVPEAPLEDVK